MSAHTRSGRPALEQAFRSPGHWHIEGWCATREIPPTRTRVPWKATDGPCQYLRVDRAEARWVYATTLEAMRDRIRDEVAG